MGITGIFGGSPRIESVAAAFASDLSRRISGGPATLPPQKTAADGPEAAAAQEAKAATLQKLESAFGDTVAYVAGKHGEQAASAMIGIMYKRLGEGEINETTLGNALLDVARFIDANFGVDEGDAFMAHLNGNLNTAMNEFFDNGLNETFFAATGPQQGGGPAGSEALLQRLAEEYAESVKTILEEARARNEEEASPVAAYTRDGEKGTLQGVMVDGMV